MNKLIIDVASEKIFLMIITKDNIYSIFYDNTKINCEKLIILINDLLNTRHLKMSDINEIYVNGGMRINAGIRNSLSVVKAINIAKKIDYYCYNLKDFKGEENISPENIPKLCNKYKIKKNLINLTYIS